MAYESIKIKDVVDRSVRHEWSIPEFQRGFVWNSTQVRDLAESLWLDYPIGSLLIWNSSQNAEERIVRDAQRPTLWVVDGQQRATALSILFGRKPYWWPSADEWEKTLKKYDIRFDVDAKESPYFWTANAAIRKVKGHRYLKNLTEAGFNISPNLLFRSLTAIGAKKVRFKEIPDKFWDANSVQSFWQSTKEAWKNLVARFRDYGILSNDPMPTEAALVTMIALVEKFPNDPFEICLYWFLQASRFRRYSGSGTTSLDEDLRDINESATQKGAIASLLKRFPHETQMEADDFLRDYIDNRFGRFLLYLLVYQNKALDWDEKGHRIGFEGVNLLADFRPQWHHIFPQKYLEGKVADEKTNALANIAVIGPTINIRISAQSPMNYLERYKIGSEKLGQQLINPDLATIPIEKFDQWLQKRAEALSVAANSFLKSFTQ